MIAYLSDFGGDNGYVAQMKAVASKITDAQLIDIAHGINRHNIRRGAFVLSNSYDYFPKKTVFVCVIDPGVGTDRRRIAAKSGDYYFVGPDNGLLHKAIEEAGEAVIHEIKNEDLFLSDVSSTFDGREVFSPIGAHLHNGIELKEVGPKVEDIEKIDFGKWQRNENELLGEVLFVDSFGNLITNIPYKEVSDKIGFGEEVKVKDKDMRFLKSYGEANKKELLLTVGGHGYLEISVNQGNAKKLINLHEREELSIKLK